MKKRMLSILLICSMMLTLLPTVAVAADDTKAIQPGTSGLQQNANTENAPTIYFGQNHENKPGAWRVVGYDGNGAAVSDVVFCPLSTKEANAVDKTLRIVDPANQNLTSNFW